MNNLPPKNSFLSGVSVLTLSTVAVKIIGLVYKIPMMHCLGAEGMGYFNSAYELYTLFFVIATAGLPVAVSILISESLARGRLRNTKKVYRVSFSLFFFIGFAGAVILGLCAKRFAQMLQSPGAHLCIAFIAPTVFFVSVASAVRGYFQGNQDMVPTAVSQVVEAVGKLLLGVLLALFAVKRGWPAERAAALAVLGLVVGSAISMLYLLLLGRFRNRTSLSIATDLSVDGAGKILRRLIILAVPVTVSAALSSLTRVVDMTLILRRLADSGYSASQAAAMFGSYSTLAVPIYHLPSSLIAGIAVSLVPALTSAVENCAEERRNSLVRTAIRLSAFVSVPCAFGLTLFGTPILSLLFSGETEAISVAAPLLAALGVSIPSVCLLPVTNAVLQAHKKASHPIISMLAGMAVKVISGYILMGIPSVSMMGAPISTLLCNLTAVGMNLYFMARCGALSWRLFPVLVRPLASASAAMAVTLAVYLPIAQKISTVGAFLVVLPICGIVYLAAAVKMGALEKEDAALVLNRKIKKKIINQTDKERQINGKYGEDPRPSW